MMGILVCGRLYATWKENSKLLLINDKANLDWEILSGQGRLYSKLLQKKEVGHKLMWIQPC